MPARAVLLLSGGLDSATCLAIARAEGFDVLALSFRYGQRHGHEVEAAGRLAAAAGVEHLVVDLDLGAYGGSALTDPTVPVPRHDALDGPADEPGESVSEGPIPITYVPARNTIFLAHALALAEVRGATDIVIGVNAVDYSGYPDCRPAFISAFERLANLATRAGVEGRRLTIHTPLISLTKAEIIRWGTELGVDYASTTSCYDPAPDGAACGGCDACLLRARGFRRAGVPDPTRYAGAPRTEGADAP